MKIVKRELIKFTLTVKTGLHIGGNKETYGIGGIDSPVIKDPITNEPIIPGSSIKGKMRMLIKYVDKAGKEDAICLKAFGPDPGSKTNEFGLSRIIFRDMFLIEESKKTLQNHLGENFFTEVKAENKIDNVNVSAQPRFIERVPAGAVFEGECIINYCDGDNEDFYRFLENGFERINYNALGGSGSRGYGKVDIKITDRKELNLLEEK